MELQELVNFLISYGTPGLIATALILLVVFAAKKSGLVATGNQARFANLLMGAVLYALGDNPKSESALMALLSSVLAALAFTGLEYLGKRFSKKA